MNRFTQNPARHSLRRMNPPQKPAGPPSKLRLRSKTGTFAALLIAALVLLALTTGVSAEGAWGGDDVLHVPMSWCVVDGTPAHARFFEMNEPSTDALIWRRHERPTDHIFLNPAGISFRSAINSIWMGTLTFPTVTDSDTSAGSALPGDVVDTGLPNNAEFSQLLQDCRSEWDSVPDVDDQINGSHGVIGIMAVNINLFHTPAGDYTELIGWGGCEEIAPGMCGVPAERYIVASDNRYFYPVDETMRELPGTGETYKRDPLDQLVGHELGRALDLPDSSDPAALMFPTQQDNVGPDLVTDNIALSPSEVTTLRANAATVDGVEVDPEATFRAGRFAAVRRVDAVREHEGVPPHLDLAGIKATIDKETDRLYLDQQLLGLAPERDAQYSAWFLLDTVRDRGATPEQLAELGVPETDFAGVDVVIRMLVAGRNVGGRGEIFYGEGDDAGFRPIEDLEVVIRTLVMYPHYSELPEAAVGPVENLGYPVYDAVSVSVAAGDVGIALKQPFTIQTFIADIEGRSVVDRLDDTEEERGRQVVISDPVFPHCFPDDEAVPGSTTLVRFDGLVPLEPVHALLGPIEAGIGEADESGNGVVKLEIPRATAAGLHLVTIGTDATALTADCVLNVTEEQSVATVDVLAWELVRQGFDWLTRLLGAWEPTR